MKKKYCNPVGVGKYTGLLLVLPFITGFVLFTLYPFLSSFITGMTDYDGIRQPEFTGLSNYLRMFSDGDFISAAVVTLKYTAILVPLKLIFSLFTAIILSMEIRGIGIYRTIFY
ncbi:MAG: sugar ABC transporter permease, partial [Ruminococcus sp.]|nr:sugar ABC transporter permease [Ruminococcus sp.]